MPDPEPSLTLVIPYYNEHFRIEGCLNGLKAYFNGREDVEIILVDDGSTDDTHEVLSRHLDDLQFDCHIIKNEVNRGKGYAVKCGMLKARGRYCLFSDFDLSTPLSEVERMLAAFEAQGANQALVIGSRIHPESKVKRRQSFIRSKMGAIFNMIMRSIIALPFNDTQCGFKLMDRKTAHELFSALQTDGFAFDVELIKRAIHAKIPVVEVGVTWINSEHSKVNILTHPFVMIKELTAIKKAMKSLPKIS